MQARSGQIRGDTGESGEIRGGTGEIYGRYMGDMQGDTGEMMITCAAARVKRSRARREAAACRGEMQGRWRGDIGEI